MHTLDLATTEKLLQNAGGFRFDCTACGNCCHGPGLVWFSVEELNNIYDYLELHKTARSALQAILIQGWQNGLAYHSAQEHCHFLNASGRCQIYPVRPLQCRTFPFWSSNFASPYALGELQKNCPGCNDPQARQYTALAIVRRCNQTTRQFHHNQDRSDKAHDL
ncbi:MAG: YkgJ family cysteine cluster protein [Leptospiraceae bacterium]|nr:YkgJ family cysteine cluster protein [Leptospiraceae bacterium]